MGGGGGARATPVVTPLGYPLPHPYPWCLLQFLKNRNGSPAPCTSYTIWARIDVYLNVIVNKTSTTWISKKGPHRIPLPHHPPLTVVVSPIPNHFKKSCYLPPPPYATKLHCPNPPTPPPPPQHDSTFGQGCKIWAKNVVSPPPPPPPPPPPTYSTFGQGWKIWAKNVVSPPKKKNGNRVHTLTCKFLTFNTFKSFHPFHHPNESSNSSFLGYRDASSRE